MELVNRLPVPAFAFRQYDENGNLDCVVSVRGTFVHFQDGTLQLAKQQEDFCWQDFYDGDPHEGVLLRQSDLTPEKVGTDVTFLGNTYAPGGRQARSWLCSIDIGPLRKAVRAHGKRMWKPVVAETRHGLLRKRGEPLLKAWSLSEAEPTDKISITWANAFGGAIPRTADEETGTAADVDRFNPLGCGIVDLGFGLDAVPHRAPLLTAPEDIDLDWRTRYVPQGLGPISPWWRQRQQYAGTYGDPWLQTRHPLLPEDFDPRFWQCADSELIAIPWLQGDEDYALENLHPRFPIARGKLPAVSLGVHCARSDRDEWHILNLDGVHFDWREDDRVLVTWRARFPLPDAGETVLTLSRVVLSDEDETPQTSKRRGVGA